MLNDIDGIIRFLDSDWYVILFKNELGTYSSALVKREEFNVPDSDDPETQLFDCDESRITDAPTPTESLNALSRKFLNRFTKNGN